MTLYIRQVSTSIMNMTRTFYDDDNGEYRVWRGGLCLLVAKGMMEMVMIRMVVIMMMRMVVELPPADQIPGRRQVATWVTPQLIFYIQWHFTPFDRFVDVFYSPLLRISSSYLPQCPSDMATRQCPDSVTSKFWDLNDVTLAVGVNDVDAYIQVDVIDGCLILVLVLMLKFKLLIKSASLCNDGKAW